MTEPQNMDRFYEALDDRDRAERAGDTGRYHAAHRRAARAAGLSEHEAHTSAVRETRHRFRSGD